MIANPGYMFQYSQRREIFSYPWRVVGPGVAVSVSPPPQDTGWRGQGGGAPLGRCW